MSTVWTRREMLQHAAMLAGGVALRSLPAQAAVAGPQVRTPLGVVAGVEKDGVRCYLGLPFAQPPVGPLRFREPKPAMPWQGVRAAVKFASSAVQPNHPDQSEDCLYLNVYTPAKIDKPLPVFVWIHGGGFTGGSPVDVDGAVFARDGVITVTIAYRLGVFGFLDWSPLLGPQYADSANNAIRDAVMALEWVQQNIGTFGGDPHRVTIGGQSAGAKMVAFLMAVDEARPLFSAAISESGGGERILDTAAAHRVTDAFAAQLSGRSHDAIMAMPPEQLIASQQRMVEAWDAPFPLRAQSGGRMLPHRAIPAIFAGSTRGKRLLIGTCRDESAAFLGRRAESPILQKNLGNTTVAQFAPVRAQYDTVYPEMSFRQRNIRAVTAEEYWVPSIRVAEAHRKGSGGPTFFYRLDETAPTGPNKGESHHGYDLGYVFEHLGSAEPPAAKVLSTQMHDAWVAFVKGETPHANGLPVWPQWDADRRSTMLFDGTSRIQARPADEELRLWNGFPFA